MSDSENEDFVDPPPVITMSAVPKSTRGAEPNFTAEVIPTSKPLKANANISVFPPVVEFQGIEPGVLYVLTISIQNVSSRVRRIRMTPPKTNNFVLNHIPTGNVAAGMDIKAEVEFQMNADSNATEYHDTITIKSDKDVIVLPLHAYIPAPNISFGGFLNLGVVVKGNTITKYVDFINDGYREGTYSIQADEDSLLSISPSEGKLAAKGKFQDLDRDGRMEEDEFVMGGAGKYQEKIKVEFVANELGPFRQLVKVSLDGQPDRVLDVCAEVMEQKLELVLNEQVIDKVPFGVIHYGEQRSVTAMLVNNGPMCTSFSINTSHLDDAPESEDADAPPIAEMEDDDDDMLPKPIVIKPQEGVIQPYSKVPVQVQFNPVHKEQTSGFVQNPVKETMELRYGLMASIESTETMQTIPVAITGTAVRPALQVSQKVFKFGECAVNDRRDVLVTIKNAGKLKLPYNMNKVANFCCKPSKGVLQPGQSQKVVVSFLPVQMGKFKNKLHLVADKSLQVIQLSVQGTATSIIGRQKKPGGINVCKEDFKPSFNFVRNEDASKAPKGGFKRRQPWENPDVDIADGEEFRNGNETHLTYSVSDQQAKVEHKNKYNNFLKDQRLKRENRIEQMERDVKMNKAGQSYDPNGIDLGMDTAVYNLPSPRLELQKAVEPLWLERPMDGMAGAKGARGRAPQHDENKLIKKKFKPKPSTQAEIRDCSMVLDADDLHCISAGPKILNFGQVCVNSTNAKSFFITNDLPTQVLAALQFQHIEELASSTPESQVIPVGGNAGFDIIFTPKTEQQFSKTVNYTINGNHTFKFTVVAQVVPITVKLSRELLNFSFNEDNLDFTAPETLTLTNPGNAVAHYKWNLRGGPFGVLPEAGALEPGESADIVVTYTPGFGAKSEEKLVMSVDCGRENTLQCVGEVEEPKCAFHDKKVDFGTVAVGMPKTKTVVLRSGGNSAAVFAIEPPPAGSGITVSPMKGRILAGERQTLQITLNASAPRDYSNIVLMAMVRGGRPAKLQFIAQAVVPDVEIQQEEFNFGGITIGATACQVLSINNLGDIPAVMHVDLTDYPDFTIEMPDELLGQDDTESIIMPIGSKANDGSEGDEYEEEEEEEEFRKWQLKALGNRTLSFHLLFTPTTVQEHSFPLPIQLLGCPDRPGLKRVVVGEGLKPRLLLSKTVVDFQSRVVARGRVKKIPYSMEVSFTNDDPESISWEVDVDVLHSVGLKEMFHVSPRAGELAPGEKAIVRFTFLPGDAKPYSCVLPLYLDENRERPYLLVTVKGVGIFPHLTFDRPELLMPVVPLHVKSTCVFHIINTGYDNLELRYRLPVDTQRVPISLNFPEGQSVGIAKEKLPVECTFTGRRPMSFMSKIDFYDEEDNKFSIPVYGTADNSLLTTYPFVCAHEEEFSLFTKETKPIMLLDNEQISNLETQMEAQSAKDRKRRRRGDDNKSEDQRRKSADITPTGRALHDKLPPFGDEDIKQLLAWCNANVLRTQVITLPDDVVAAHGRPVIDMVSITSGKQVPGQIKNPPQDSAERWRMLLDFYNGFLTFLKSYGALLHNIVPEQLLNKEDYTRAKEAKDTEKGTSARITPAAAMQRRHHWEREWLHIAREAWAQVMMQVVRVFVLGRVTLKKFRDLPGMPPPTPRPSPRAEQKGGRRGQQAPEPVVTESDVDPQLLGSNVYSTSECILLKWMTYHVNQNLTAADPVRLVNFDACLQDGTVICNLLASHVPSLEQNEGPLAGYHREVTDASQAQENCAMVTAAMESLGMSYRISPEQLAEIHSRNGVLLVLYLYQQLPQFIPKTTIEFAGSLGEPIRKSIELRNPSRKKITYSVTLEGSSDFRILTNSITLDGERSGSFPIELYPRFSKPVEGRLTFRSRREGGVSAATMVFLLRSDIQSRQAVRTVRLENPMYDGKQIDMEIANPFEQDCVFQVSLKQEQITFGGGANMLGGEEQGRFGGGPKGQPAQAGRPPRAPRQDFATVEPHLQPFWCKTSSVRIRAGGSVVLPVHFLPFSEGQYRAQLIFLDEKAGEFLYEIFADATLPVPLEQVRFSTDLAVGRVDKDVTIPVKNVSLQRAYQTAVDRLTGAAKNKARDNLKKKESETQQPTVFMVSLNSPYFSSQTQQLMVQPGADAKGGDSKITLSTPRNAGVGANNVPISFSPHAAGKFTCQLIMRPMDSMANDVRVYEFEVNVTAPGVKTALEFNTPARQVIFQEIPITNNSELDWMLSVSIQGSRTFKGPPRLSVPSGKTANFTLSFQPEWVCEEHASLVLSNTQSGEKFEYELTGNGEEPLAEDHIIVSCQARDKVEQTFMVHNTRMQPVMFSVESDLPHVSGESSIEVPPNSSAPYSLTICPQLGGMYTGSITFMEPTGEFLWYTCEIQASSPEPEQTLEISSTVRRAVSVEISLANPLDEHVQFDVDLTGAGLLGDLNFSLGPQETATYELLFSPLVPGEQTGSVSFSNDKLGEFWYRLALTADPAPPHELEGMSCPVGLSVGQSIVLENPTGQEVTLQAKVDNRKNFTVSPAAVALAPYGTAEAVLEYTPSSLDEDEEAEIVFKHENLGEWVYLVKGRGKMPGEMDTVVVPTPIGLSASQSFPFRNPFGVPLQIQANLQADTREVLDLFKLLLKKPTLNVPAFSTIQIPISFSPNIIAERLAWVDITTASVPAADGSKQELKWAFPLRGIAEAPPFERAFNFKCQARKHLEEVLSVQLRGLGDIAEGEEEEFTHELVVPEEESKGFVDRSFFVRPRVNRLTDKTVPLEFDILFEPLRPFSTTVELVVNKKSGGRWRFEVQLEALDPEVDDVITIEAALNRTSSVSFKIQNQFKSFAPFTAEFSSNSSLAFTVFPQQGQLEPFGGEGQEFVISFTPTEYGKMQTGNLIIVTDDFQWTYEMRGTHQEYQVPAAKSKVSTKLEAGLAQRLGKGKAPKNILRKNMEKEALKANGRRAPRK